MLTIFGRPSAYNVQKVLWFAEELGVEYKHVNMGGSLGGLDSAEFLALNPNGLAPVIQDDGFAVWESNTIIRYLAATYGGSKFWIKSPTDRSIADRWMDWELSKLQPSILSLFWQYYRTPEDQRNIKRIEYLIKRSEHDTEILDSHLEQNKFVSGEKFGIGDICIGTCFFRYFNMGIEVSKPAYVNEWYTRLCERPCYKKIIMVPFDELKGRLKS